MGPGMYIYMAMYITNITTGRYNSVGYVYNYFTGGPICVYLLVGVEPLIMIADSIYV